MSEVTNLLVAFSILEDDEDRLDDLNQWLNARDQAPLVDLWRRRECYGGSKNMEAPLFAGAFNYFELGPFLEHLRTIRWNEPAAVQVLIRAPGEVTWRIIAG